MTDPTFGKDALVQIRYIEPRENKWLFWSFRKNYFKELMIIKGLVQIILDMCTFCCNDKKYLYINDFDV